MGDFPPARDETERLLLEAAVAEARADGETIPQEVMRQRMMDMIAEARRRTTELTKARRD
ncbi:hypothetical protein [Falsiroseomonas ponticola]|jgi:hypothetical protein|uniref:hypothetical protein n=1 Tax=Falsiroseomonas ponticola TaxID=2786951 RepID=UPI00193436FA|nr:hypothetical protein [Roseomonas ponticola]